MKEFCPTKVTLPELGTRKVRFSLWYVEVGETVVSGDRIAEVLIPGATYEVAAPVTGTLIAKHKYPNEPIDAGDVLGLIEEDIPRPGAM